MEYQDIFHRCVDEMYTIADGTKIERADEILLRFDEICITRKQIKHIIERRKTDGKSPHEIKQILDYLLNTVFEFDFETTNSTKKYPGSVCRIKVFKGWNRGMVLVVDGLKSGQRGLITAYPQRLLHCYTLLLKKLRTSTAGKTPHP